MRLLFLCCIMSISTQLFAQELDRVYFKKVPKRIFFNKFSVNVIPKHYIYVHLNNDCDIIYINTIGSIGRNIEVIQDNYEMDGDSLFFSKNFAPGKLTNDKLYIPLACWGLKKAKISDVEKFIKEYGCYLKEWKKICFHNGYAMPCENAQCEKLYD